MASKDEKLLTNVTTTKPSAIIINQKLNEKSIRAYTHDILRLVCGIADEDTWRQRFRSRERVGPVATCDTGQHECRHKQTQACPSGGSSATSFRHSLVSRALCGNEKKKAHLYRR